MYTACSFCEGETSLRLEKYGKCIPHVVFVKEKHLSNYNLYVLQLPIILYLSLAITSYIIIVFVKMYTFWLFMNFCV